MVLGVSDACILDVHVPSVMSMKSSGPKESRDLFSKLVKLPSGLNLGVGWVNGTAAWTGAALTVVVSTGATTGAVPGMAVSWMGIAVALAAGSGAVAGVSGDEDRTAPTIASTSFGKGGGGGGLANCLFRSNW